MDKPFHADSPQCDDFANPTYWTRTYAACRCDNAHNTNRAPKHSEHPDRTTVSTDFTHVDHVATSLGRWEVVWSADLATAGAPRRACRSLRGQVKKLPTMRRGHVARRIRTDGKHGVNTTPFGGGVTHAAVSNPTASGVQRSKSLGCSWIG